MIGSFNMARETVLAMVISVVDIIVYSKPVHRETSMFFFVVTEP